jgi:hypothetical protein
MPPRGDSCRNGRGSGALPTLPTMLVWRYKYGAWGEPLLLPHPNSLLLTLPVAPLRRTRKQRRSSAVALLRSGADARRRPTSSSTMPPPPLLSQVLLGETRSPSATSPPLLHQRRSSSGEFFTLCSFFPISLCYWLGSSIALLLDIPRARLTWLAIFLNGSRVFFRRIFYVYLFPI